MFGAHFMALLQRGKLNLQVQKYVQIQHHLWWRMEPDRSHWLYNKGADECIVSDRLKRLVGVGITIYSKF